MKASSYILSFTLEPDFFPKIPSAVTTRQKAEQITYPTQILVWYCELAARSSRIPPARENSRPLGLNPSITSSRPGRGSTGSTIISDGKVSYVFCEISKGLVDSLRMLDPCTHNGSLKLGFLDFISTYDQQNPFQPCPIVIQSNPDFPEYPNIFMF
jgi:hypothetical protein